MVRYYVVQAWIMMLSMGSRVNEGFEWRRLGIVISCDGSKDKHGWFGQGEEQRNSSKAVHAPNCCKGAGSQARGLICFLDIVS